LGESYRYPIETEQKLIGFIRLGEFVKAWAVLNQVINDNIQPGIPEYMKKILISDLSGTLMKGLLTPEITIPVEPPAELLLTDTMIDYYKKTLNEICRANRSFLEEKHSRNLGERVKKYINENFRNPDLNVSITALHFSLTPAYISKIFLQDTGFSLLEYINNMRVEESKKLLAQGQSIIKTAELVGFRGSNTFIRIFRKMTGFTPGQYKNMC
jgi:AraC-like DNA-binding protein